MMQVWNFVFAAYGISFAALAAAVALTAAAWRRARRGDQ